MADNIVNKTVDGTFRQTNLTNESPEYLAKREELRLAEIELMKQRERVAEMRRHLPEGVTVQDYEFEEGPRELNAGDSPITKVRLSELFTKPDRSLVIYHFMFGKKNSKACPMCTAWLDGSERRRASPRAKSRFRRRRGRRRPDAARIRSRARLGQAAPAQRRKEYVQVRFRQRKSRRRAGLDAFRFHA